MSAYAVQAYEAQPETIKLSSRTKKILIACVIAVILVLVPLCLTVGIYLKWAGSSLLAPGIVIGQTEAGGLSKDEAIQQIDRIYNQDTQIIISIGAQNFTYHLLELGILVDAPLTVENAWQIGRGDGAISETLGFLQGKKSFFTPVTYINPDMTRATLQQLASQITVAPVNATIAMQNGMWVALPSQNGVTLDIEAIVAVLQADPTLFIANGSIPAALVTVPPQVTDVSGVLTQIQTLINRTYTLNAYDPIRDETITWTVSPEKMYQWVNYDPVSGNVSFQLEQIEIELLLQEYETTLSDDREIKKPVNLSALIAAWENDQPYMVVVRHPATSYTVQGGESLWSISLDQGMPLYRIMNANPGLGLDGVRAGMTLVIPSKSDLIPLTPVIGKRIVVSISQQKMWTYENGQVRSESIISTGISSSPTMAGVFQVQSHVENAFAGNWNLWMPHFMGIYEAWPDFMNGFHGLPLLSGGNRLWASNLGTPVSYGCIILALDEAEDLYYWAEDGVIVEIIN